MASGGARTRSGPAPDPSALRRDRDSKEWLKLTGPRTGPAPAWPLPRPTKRELDLWELEWKRPQAVMWEANGQELEVAMYVRSFRQAEAPTAVVALRTLVRQQMDALGLTTPGLRANRWIIVEPESIEQSPQPPAGPSVKERLRVVQGGSGA